MNAIDYNDIPEFDQKRFNKLFSKKRLEKEIKDLENAEEDDLVKSLILTNKVMHGFKTMLDFYKRLARKDLTESQFKKLLKGFISFTKKITSYANQLYQLVKKEEHLGKELIKKINNKKYYNPQKGFIDTPTEYKGYRLEEELYDIERSVFYILDGLRTEEDEFNDYFDSYSDNPQKRKEDVERHVKYLKERDLWIWVYHKIKQPLLWAIHTVELMKKDHEW
ncbi:MAG: hypothetical protein ABIJ08_03455 [Nanoarchaeota archaeon]